MHTKRKSGVLLHPTSLPGPEGIGSFGAEAFRFLDFLESAGQSLWQVLPLGPAAYGNSPYSCYSAFAGNPLLIDLELLAEDGDLPQGVRAGDFPAEWVDYKSVEAFKLGRLREAAAHFFANAEKARLEMFWRFCDATVWLHDYALFMALKGHFAGKSWSEWPGGIAGRDPASLDEYSVKLGAAIGEQKYIQWQFFSQWWRLKAQANRQGISIIGDTPIFVAYDSADVWANRHLFFLDDKGRPTVVAGVPPDYFSKSGQLWGNPLYNWDRMSEDGYAWWISRVRNDLMLYDMVRIDHFRGFESYWEVPAGEKTAVNGRWTRGGGDGFFNALRAAIGALPIIAEDLGIITPEVEGLRDRFGLPGMKILQFAFGSGADNPYLPHNHIPCSVVYTGTHDNDTTLGWFAGLKEKERKRVLKYLHIAEAEMPWDLIRVALASVAEIAVIPMQDILGLGSEARMNLPGTAHGNWGWRFDGSADTKAAAQRLRGLVEMYGRC